jgi:hypothetical protein
VAFNKAVLFPFTNPSAVTEPAAGSLADWTPHSTFADATIALTAGFARGGHFGRSIRMIARTLASVNAAAVTNTYVRAFGES